MPKSKNTITGEFDTLKLSQVDSFKKRSFGNDVFVENSERLIKQFSEVIMFSQREIEKLLLTAEISEAWK